MADGRQIIEAFRNLRLALGADVTSVTVDGKTWVRQDADSPHDLFAQARNRIADLQTMVDMQGAEIERLLMTK
jgi:hypothetical protein